MEYIRYMIKIQEVLGKTKSPDKIHEEKWEEMVMRELSKISKDVAKELQNELNIKWNKGNGYLQELFEAPPTRLLALILFLAAWIGWIMNEKDKTELLTVDDCLQKIEEAVYYGKRISEENPSKDLKYYLKE